ncbi:hypothetical protein V2J09_012479 [Rumex salicifolius]
MPKKRSWFNRIKELIFPVTDEEEKKLKKSKKKKKKKWLLRLMRTTKRPPSLAAPSLSEERIQNKAFKEEIHQPDLHLEASNGSGFVGVNLPTTSFSTSQCENQTAEIGVSHSQLLKHVEDLAATKIQTAFRGYLGLVRLQAIIRGRAVRRQAVATLKSLQSIVNIHSQVCKTRYQVAKETRPNEDDRLKNDLSRHYRRWDDRLATKEEENAIVLTKTEAMMRRHRMKAYSFNHRHSADQLEEARRNGRLRSWLEENTEDDVPQKEEIKMVDTIGGKQMRGRSNTKEAMGQESPRRAVHRRKRRPVNSGSNGKMDAGEPAYMAATQSARARARTTSCSPRLRPNQLDCFSDGDSPYKVKISPMSSINSERTFSGGVMSAKYVMMSSCKGINLSPKPYFEEKFCEASES